MEVRLCYWTDTTRTDLKGEHVLAVNSQIFSIPSEGSHNFCFKLLARGSGGAELIMSAENTNQRMKWIMAVESLVLDLKNSAEEELERLSAVSKDLSEGGLDSDEPNTSHISTSSATSASAATNAGGASGSSGGSGMMTASAAARSSHRVTPSQQLVLNVAEKIIVAWMNDDEATFNDHVSLGNLTSNRTIYEQIR